MYVYLFCCIDSWVGSATDVHCSVLQYVAVCWSVCGILSFGLPKMCGRSNDETPDTLQHTATYCNILQHTKHTATHCTTLQHTPTRWSSLQLISTHCNTLGYRFAADGFKTPQTLQRTATHCNALQLIPARCHSLQLTPTNYATDDRFAADWVNWRHIHCNTLQHPATHCNTLQHTATHCNTLQLAATHSNTLCHRCAEMCGRWNQKTAHMIIDML